MRLIARKSLPCAIAAAAVALALVRSAGGAAPIHYRFTFAEPEHHWMQIEASFTDLARAPLELRMSRSSPGRYSVHDFAKNVYDVHALAQDSRELAIARPDPSAWTINQ